MPLPSRYIAITIIMLALALPVWSSFGVWTSDKRIAALHSGQKDTLLHAVHLNQLKHVRHPKEWIETAELLSARSPDNDALAISLLKRSLKADDRSPNAWAHLAFLLTRQAGALNEEAEAALQRSFALCLYCEKTLVRWRFTFTLQHWTRTSEETRLAAFSGADFLRWWHLDYDYLGEVRSAALALGIPFDEYRKKIPTPVRPNEIGL